MSADPLKLAELFSGGGEAWQPLLEPVLRAQPEAADFVGPARMSSVVPVRELMFQALKPNPPEDWKVIVFGQNPYPRVESATGIAMFDNAFQAWKDSKFGRTVSMRCIIKAAAIWKYDTDPKTKVGPLRELLDAHDIVTPPEWFQAMLTQGVLLLNAALTASSDGATPTARHTAFWRPVIERIVEAIFEARAQRPGERGLVFLWWGSHARALRGAVEDIARRFPAVPVRHVDHCNPAAQGDMFCRVNHFKVVNETLRQLNLEEVDWLPREGWDAGLTTSAAMGQFITETQRLHELYLERLASVADEAQAELPAITGILGPPPSFAEAAAALDGTVTGLGWAIDRAQSFAQAAISAGQSRGLSADEVAALYLSTCETPFYRRINATLRDARRELLLPYAPWLRLLFSAFGKLTKTSRQLYRGVALDLRRQYPKGRRIVWWGVSSCTPKLSVARGFLGSSGRRTLFRITPRRAVSIADMSAYGGEEEVLLAPGTALEVVKVAADRRGLLTIDLREADADWLIT